MVNKQSARGEIMWGSFATLGILAFSVLLAGAIVVSLMTLGIVTYTQHPDYLEIRPVDFDKVTLLEACIDLNLLDEYDDYCERCYEQGSLN